MAASFRDTQRQLMAKLDAAEAEWKASLKEKPETVTEEMVAEVVSMMSGVPVQRIGESEGLKLVGMKDSLKAAVVGQDEAVNKIVKAIQRNRIGLKDLTVRSARLCSLALQGGSVRLTWLKRSQSNCSTLPMH